MKTWVRCICVLLVALVCFSACSSAKTPLTAAEFRVVMEGNGLEVTDVSAAMGLADGEAALYAQQEDGLTLEFYVMADADQAATAFDAHRQAFEAGKGNASAQNSLKGPNYQKFTLSTGGRYMVVCQVANTLLYVDTVKDNKSTVQALMESMNY